MNQKDTGNNNVDITEQLPTVLSLCTGLSGLERGLKLAGLEHRVLAHVEIEAYAIANLLAKMETGLLVPAPVFSNIKTLPVSPFRDRVDILTSGYPCQPFSAAGKRQGEEDPRHLWPYIKEIIRAVRPVRCFFENVEGHISLGLREVIEDLEGLGYRTAWGIFSAREVGASHQRKRVFIMADTPRIRVQRLRSSGVEEPDSHGQKELSLRESQRPEYAKWEAEPRICRVVDGVRNRIDRIRLLGNSVVPRTAAKAWLTLQQQIEDSTIA
jgi:site-specific DNA-cytosine methylase